MIVNKFGGASVKDAMAIKRMGEICKKHISSGIIVVSAMGKTTNLLENMAANFYKKKSNTIFFEQLATFYKNIIVELFPKNDDINKKIGLLLEQLNNYLNTAPSKNFDFEYDQIVSYGEIISTQIIDHYLASIYYKVKWCDVRESLKTDTCFREAKVNWEESERLIKKHFSNSETEIYLTQGFIAMNKAAQTTTLGREGSDYTAAIFANMLDAEKVVVWKDVPGILCSDPSWIPNTPKLEEISYLEAVELTYFGAKVIHPKTIKPLQNKNIPLQVRSFLDTNEKGTLISNLNYKGKQPIFIRKENQVLITIKPNDFSFIVEENLSHIFGILATNRVKVNIMQNSAISFSIVTDAYAINGMQAAISELRKFYDVKYNDHLELISMRHTNTEIEKKIIKDYEILLEQRSRSTVRFAVRVKKYSKN